MNLTQRQAADIIDQIEQIAARMRRLEPELRRRAVDSGPDGYPPSSGLDGPAHGAHPDPVGTIVAIRVDRPQRDPVGNAHRKVLAGIDEARRILEQAESAGRQALPPAAVDLNDGCVSCARIGRWSPICRTRRCRWCSDWAYAHAGDDPPVDLLRAHHEGRRVTVRLVETITRRRRR